MIESGCTSMSRDIGRISMAPARTAFRVGTKFLAPYGNANYTCRWEVFLQTIIFHGLKRSGNHAVINWMRSVEDFPFHNNVAPFDIYKGKGGNLLPWQFIQREQRRGYRSPSRRLISTEDMEITQPAFRGIPADALNVILVRSAENVFASRIRKASATRLTAYSTEPASLKRALDLWLQHAREMLGITSHLRNRIGIYFDRWVIDRDYRSRIANQLGLPCDDAALTEQAKEGGGSSFQTDSSGVLSRSSLLTSTEKDILDRLLQNGEVQELSRLLQMAPAR